MRASLAVIARTLIPWAPLCGGLLTGKETSFLLAARKWWEQWRSADAAWLHMDRPENLMVVTALLWLRTRDTVATDTPA